MKLRTVTAAGAFWGTITVVGLGVLAVAPESVRSAFREHPLRTALALFPATTALVASALAWVHAWRRASPAVDRPLPRYAIVLAAHDEERGLASTLDAIVADVGGRAPIHVVSDGSTDRTVEIARRFASRGVIVHELPQRRGKSAALAHALEAVDAPFVVTLDADTRPDPGAIERLVHTCAGNGVGAATGAIRAARADGILRAMQAFEYAAIVGPGKRAEDVIGAMFTVSGAAAAYATDAVRAVGGFASTSATEDIDLSWRLQRAGHRVRYAADAGFRVETPATWRALVLQRTRWSLGLFQVLRRCGNPLAYRRTAFGAVFAHVVSSMAYAPWLVASLIAALWACCVHGATPFSSATSTSIMRLATEALVVQALLGAVLARGAGPRPWMWPIAVVLFPLYHLAVLVPAYFAGALRAARANSTPIWERSPRGEATHSPPETAKSELARVA